MFDHSCEVWGGDGTESEIKAYRMVQRLFGVYMSHFGIVTKVYGM